MLALPSPLEVSLASVCCGQFRQTEEQLDALDPMFCSMTRDNRFAPFENIFYSLGGIEAMTLSSTDTFLKWGKRQLRVTYSIRKARRNIHATFFFLSLSPSRLKPAPKIMGA